MWPATSCCSPASLSGLNSGLVLGRHSPFDGYPYQFLNLAVALEAVFLSTFVLMSQNRQNAQAEQ